MTAVYQFSYFVGVLYAMNIIHEFISRDMTHMQARHATKIIGTESLLLQQSS